MLRYLLRVSSIAKTPIRSRCQDFSNLFIVVDIMIKGSISLKVAGERSDGSNRNTYNFTAVDLSSGK